MSSPDHASGAGPGLGGPRLGTSGLVLAIVVALVLVAALLLATVPAALGFAWSDLAASTLDRWCHLTS